MVVVAPLPDGTFRIVATVDSAPEVPDVAFVQQLLDTRGPKAAPVAVREVVWGSRFRVHHRVADTFRHGRVLLAGDAAHVHSPAGGQGMNLGIDDAAALGEALSRVLQGPHPRSSTGTPPRTRRTPARSSPSPGGSPRWRPCPRTGDRLATWCSGCSAAAPPSAAAWPGSSPAWTAVGDPHRRNPPAGHKPQLRDIRCWEGHLLQRMAL
ncbi:FAD-dependent monooxygenase [Catellatospora coxensis]